MTATPSQRKTHLLAFSLMLCGMFLHPLAGQEVPERMKFHKHRYTPGYGLKKLQQPEIFQGNKKKKNYFEGWYFKMVSSDGSAILSVIPGISLSHDGKEQHAFIQVIDGITAHTDYYSFPIEEFSFSGTEFAISIGPNHFTAGKLILNLQSDSSSLSGEIHMTNTVSFPSRRILNPGIMGWYRFVPMMECYHAVVSLTHNLEGSLVSDGRKLDFSGGLGYIEKDWGSSMPTAWIWMQSNHFTQGNSSFMLSVAHIPWMGRSFTGFLGFFQHESILYRFATYTKARIQVDDTVPDEISIRISDSKFLYHIETSRDKAGMLKAPVKGSMDRRIAESIDARLRLRVYDLNGTLLFSDSTSIAGFEQVGDQDILIRGIER